MLNEALKFVIKENYYNRLIFQNKKVYNNLYKDKFTNILLLENKNIGWLVKYFKVVLKKNFETSQKSSNAEKRLITA